MKTLSTIALLLFSVTVFSQSGEKFALPSPLPFDNIKKHHPIDNDCGAKGDPAHGNTAANNLQNEAKNNFWATGTPNPVTTQDLITLHKKVKPAGITYGNAGKVPADRSGLQSLGEGTQVVYTGYIIDAKYSNTENGEGVNCNEGGNNWNDIHISLAKTKGDTVKCEQVTAEMSPHYRPVSWNVKALKSIRSKGLKVRVTGQLFFDASHTCCQDSKGGNQLKRASGWEVHPVYAFEVFVNHAWKALNDYVEEED